MTADRHLLPALVLAAEACSQTYANTPCSITCSDEGLCPEAMTCGADDYCHAADDATDCSPDAPPALGTPDAGAGLPDGRMASDTAPGIPDAFVPTPDAQCGFLWPEQELSTDESMRSCNGNYFLLMQSDDNLVLYQESGSGDDIPLWSSDTVGSGAVRARMQGDGNFVLYRPCSPCTAGDAVWASNTEDNAGAYLIVRNDGRLIITSSGGAQLWRRP